MSDLILHAIILIVLASIATLAVALRFWARKIQKIAPQTSDYLIVIGLILTLTQSLLNFYNASYTFAQEPGSPREPGKAKRLGAQLSFVSPIIWVIAVTMIRSSVLSLFIHVFPTRPFRLACTGVLTLSAAFCVSTILATCLICSPISYQWDFSVRDGSCGNQKLLDLFIAIFNLLLDSMIVVLPMRIVWRLRVPIRKKVLLCAMFGMGIAICIITAYRIHVTATMGQPGDPRSIDKYDLICLLSWLEADFGIMIACLPVLKPIYDKLHAWITLPDVWKDTVQSCTSCIILTLMRVRRIFNSTSGKRNGTEALEPVDSVDEEDWGNQSRGAPRKTRREDALGYSVPEIHVRKDVDIESVLRED